MVTFLTHIFIKNKDDTTSPDVRQAYGILSGAVGIFFNLLLFSGKFLAGYISKSIAITADALNNLSDASSSVITLIGFKIAGQKPDPDHPFGHGRIEYLSGLLISAAILIMAFELITGSVKKIFAPDEVHFSYLILIILVVSILVKLYMFLYNRAFSRKIKSEALMATAKDSLSDIVSTSVVLITTLISHYFHLNLDAYCGILVGLFIFYTGVGAAKDTLDPLLGQAPDPEFVKSIEEIVMSHEGILGIHDLLVHNYGPGRVMISLHAEVPASGDIMVLHDLIDNIERELKETLLCDAVIHMDPVLTDDPEVKSLKEMTYGCLKEIDKDLTLHDFRVVKGPTHTNLIFDIVTPFGYSYSDSEIASLITDKIKAINPNLYTVIQVDKKYS